jgi:hypothetical protein
LEMADAKLPDDWKLARLRDQQERTRACSHWADGPVAALRTLP